MQYISTRGQAKNNNFNDTLLTGLAGDGGLYLPERWPQLDKKTLCSFQNKTYAQVAFAVIKPFVTPCIDHASLGNIVTRAYQHFSSLAPTKMLKKNLYVCELFHGPTLAFKDFGLQLLAQLFDHALEEKRQKITIIGATSGDTGSAAIEACKNKRHMDIFMLHPLSRPSKVQRMQMTTIHAANVYNLAIKGTFDDCQDLVKGLFNDRTLDPKFHFSAVNSINWARIMAQIVYYIYAATRIGSPHIKVSFSVPTGNFGNALAAYFAMKMGLPVEKIMIASNENDILTRFFCHRDMSIKNVVKTYSTSMDIQVSSNFERLLFEFIDRDARTLRTIMQEFRKTGVMPVSEDTWKRIVKHFQGFSLSNINTLQAIDKWHKITGKIFDPHSVIALEASERMDTTTPTICMATAHVAKFAHIAKKATGKNVLLPKSIEDLLYKKEKYTILDNTYASVVNYIKENTATS